MGKQKDRSISVYGRPSIDSTFSHTSGLSN